MSGKAPPEFPDKAVDPTGFKARIQRFYEFWNAQLEDTVFGAMSLFMNWGYWPIGPGEAALEPPPGAINASAIRLILEMVGSNDLRDRDILDVGCGRGGTVDTLLRQYQPRAVTGLDLTPRNIAFCRQAVTAPRARFVEGDAEAMPFDDAAFDIVTNLESSHCYPDIARFYREVARVLRPGGVFLYADVFDHATFAGWKGMMADAGLDVEHDRDITANVLLARDIEGREQADVLGVPGDRAVAADPPDNGGGDADILDLVMARPGSEMHGALLEGRLGYRILRARRRTSRAPGGRAIRPLRRRPAA